MKVFGVEVFRQLRGQDVVWKVLVATDITQMVSSEMGNGV